MADRIGKELKAKKVKRTESPNWKELKARHTKIARPSNLQQKTRLEETWTGMSLRVIPSYHQHPEHALQELSRLLRRQLPIQVHLDRIQILDTTDLESLRDELLRRSRRGQGVNLSTVRGEVAINETKKLKTTESRKSKRAESGIGELKARNWKNWKLKLKKPETEKNWKTETEKNRKPEIWTTESQKLENWKPETGELKARNWTRTETQKSEKELKAGTGKELKAKNWKELKARNWTRTESQKRNALDAQSSSSTGTKCSDPFHQISQKCSLPLHFEGFVQPT